MCAGVLIFCVIGAYGLKQSLFDVWVMLGFGIIGYLLRKLDFPIAPAILALILGPMMEKSLRTTLEISGGSFADLPRPAGGARAARRAGDRDRLPACSSRARSLRSGRPTSSDRCSNCQPGRKNNAHPSPHPARRLGGHGAVASPALAQNYPRRAVQLIVAFPAGGSTDVGARIVAASAEKDSASRSLVVNKAGAGGQIGFTEAARARPDGYTLGFLNLPGINTIALDPERKAVFTHRQPSSPIINQVLDPGMIWVKADSPYKTLGRPDRRGEEEPGQDQRLHHRHPERRPSRHPDDAGGRARCEFRIVHFDGGAQQLTGVLGGHVDVAFDNVGGVFKRVRSGEMPRRWPSPTTSAPSSCPTCRPPGARLSDGHLLLDARHRRVQKGTPADDHQGARGRAA